MNPQFSIKNGIKSGGIGAILALLLSLLTQAIPSISCLMCLPTLALYIGAGALASYWDRRDNISQTNSGATISGAIAGILTSLGDLLATAIFNLISPPTNTQVTPEQLEYLSALGITLTTMAGMLVVFFVFRFVIAAVLGVIGSTLTKRPNVEEMKQKNNIAGLIKALNYQKDPAIPMAAIKALGETGKPQAVEALIVALRNVDHEMRQAAVHALTTQMDSDNILDKLIVVIQNEGLTQDVRQELVLSLEKSDNEKAKTAVATYKEQERQAEEKRKEQEKLESLRKEIDSVLRQWSAFARYARSSKHPESVLKRIGHFDAKNPTFLPIGNGGFKLSANQTARIVAILMNDYTWFHRDHFNDPLWDQSKLLQDAVKRYLSVMQDLLLIDKVNKFILETTIVPLIERLGGNPMEKDVFTEVSLNAIDLLVQENISQNSLSSLASLKDIIVHALYIKNY